MTETQSELEGVGTLRPLHLALAPPLLDKEIAGLVASHAPNPVGIRVPGRFHRRIHSLCGGSHFAVRELLTSDAQACNVFLDHLDPQDVKLRFGSLHSTPRYLLPSRGAANQGAAFGALDAAGAILGVANLEYVNSDLAEAAVIVRSDYKRHGIGRSLLEQTIKRAVEDGASQVTGYVLAENKAMLSLARAMGFQSIRWDEFYIEVSWLISSWPL